MNTLPEKWYIVATEDNYDELNAWRQTRSMSCLNSFKIGNTLLSEHPMDNSYYYGDSLDSLRRNSHYDCYQEITIEQFRQITNSTPKPMTKSIQISRNLLNEYYVAATGPQKAYLTEHFKLDGTTTDEAIRGLHEMACSDWKPRIKRNHPECFSEDSKYFDFSAYVSERGHCGVIEHDVAELLGLSSDFIEIRCSGVVYGNRSFYLSNDYCWELIKEGADNVLIPTKKQS